MTARSSTTRAADERLPARHPEALIWWPCRPDNLHPDAHQAIGQEDVSVHYSAMSGLEIALKARKGQLKLPPDFAVYVDRQRFTPLPVTLAHALAVQVVPIINEHRNPFDPC